MTSHRPCQTAVRDELKRTKGDVPAAKALMATCQYILVSSFSNLVEHFQNWLNPMYQSLHSSPDHIPQLRAMLHEWDKKQIKALLETFFQILIAQDSMITATKSRKAESASKAALKEEGEEPAKDDAPENDDDHEGEEEDTMVVDQEVEAAFQLWSVLHGTFCNSWYFPTPAFSNSWCFPIYPCHLTTGSRVIVHLALEIFKFCVAADLRACCEEGKKSTQFMSAQCVTSILFHKYLNDLQSPS